MKQIYQAILIAAVTISIFSCSKKDGNTPPNGNNNPTSVSIVGSWTLVAFKTDTLPNPLNPSSDDVYAQFPACAKDDIYIFKADGTTEYNDGVIKCDPNETPSSYGTYTLANTVLNLSSYNGYPISNATVLKLTADTLSFHCATTMDDSQDTTHPLATLTFKRKS